MGIFDWLFKPKPEPAEWRVSANGNPTIEHGGVRYTVFEQDDEWTIVIADPQDRWEPIFDDGHASRRNAMDVVADMIVKRAQR